MKVPPLAGDANVQKMSDADIEAVAPYVKQLAGGK